MAEGRRDQTHLIQRISLQTRQATFRGRGKAAGTGAEFIENRT